ncbi:zinc finger BED domain-containing protein 4-like [Hydra vulgaris]|uniref:Zinc finger BED domain-containing protein 4-like n=1 Tax=Hydra vulgaris TaxID=6087 RepID=A0ABM4CS98_HYDVU
MAHEKYHVRYIRTTVQNGGGSIGVWSCFNYKGVGTCKLPVQCPTGATKGLYAHLRAAHPKAHKECVARNEENRKRKLAEQELKNENKKQSKVDDPFKKKAHWSSSHPNAIAITNSVGRMLALDMLPYDFVEGRGFKELMKLMEPQYLVPNRTTVKQKTANEIYRDFEDIPSYSFTTDLWTSRAQDPFIYFYLSYVSPEFELKTFALENKPFPGEHTGESILESLDKTIDNWELHQTVPIYALSDNGSNIKSAMNLSQSFYDLSCFDHTLQLTIDDANLHREQKQLGNVERELIINVATRWNSDYFMLKRFCEEKDAISAELSISEKIDNLTYADWKLAEGYHTILAPFEQASRKLCGKNYSTLSMKIPALLGLNQQLQRFINDPSHKGCGVLIARKLKLKLDRRFQQFRSALPNAACPFLNPRYKSIFFSEQQQASVVDRTSASAGASAPTFGSAGPGSDPGRTSAAASKQSSLWDDFDSMLTTATANRMLPVDDEVSVQEEVRMYMIEPPIGRNANVLDWWKCQRIPHMCENSQ